MKKLNKKAFTLVEIVVAIGILAAASVGIGAIVVAVQNNSQKQFSQGDMQQQLSDVQDSLKNDLLTTNAGVKYWIQDDLGGYVESDGANKNPDRNKIVAMYAMDYIDNTLTKTYVKYDANEDVLYKAEISDTVLFDHSKKKLLDEKPDEVLNDSSLDWYVYAQGVSNFSMDLSKYSENQTINYNVNLTNDNTDYESDNTVNIRNEIPINEATILENYDQAIISKPALQRTEFTYNGREITPKQLDVNSRYVEIRITDPEKDRISATNVGTYRITYHLKNAVWSDGSSEDYTIEWKIKPRALGVEWDDHSWAYSGSTYTVTYQLSEIADVDAMLTLVTLHNGTIGPDYGTQTAYLEVINPNYTIEQNGSIEISITKGSAEYTIAPTPAGTKDNPLIYNGQEQALVNPGSTTCGTIYYSLSANTGFSTEVPKAKSANDETPYIVYYYIKGEGSYADSEKQYMEVVMNRAIPAIDKPIPFDGVTNKVYYNGGAQSLLYYEGKTSAATSNDANLVYSLDGDVYTSEIPTGVTAKQYTIWYKSKQTADFKETTPQYVEAKILKSERPLDSFTLPQTNSLIYNGLLQPLFKPGTGTASQAQGWMYKLEDGEWSFTIPEKDAAGDYAVYLKVPETADYAEYELETPIIVTIEKAPAQFVLNGQPQALPNLVYNGQSQNLIANGLTRDGLVYYGISVDDVAPNKDSFSMITPQGISAGVYKVFYYIKGDDNHLDSDIISISAEIQPAQPFVTTPPIALTGFYNGENQSLIIVQGQSGSGIPLQYSLTGDDGTWGEVPPTAVNANTYTVYYKVPANSNYSDSIVGKVLATIQQAETKITAPQSIIGLSYNGEYQQLCTSGESEFGQIEYSVNSQQQWSYNIPQALNAGKYDIYWRVQETSNYKGASGKITSNIAKQQLDITPPSPLELTYSGIGQVLIDTTSGSVPPGYHFEYRLSDPTAVWSTIPPMKTNAGIYSIEYRVVADDNAVGGNVDSSKEVLVAKINPVVPTIHIQPATGLVYNMFLQDLIDENLTTINFGSLEYSLTIDGMYSRFIPMGDKAGTYTIFWQTESSPNIVQQKGVISVNIAKLSIDFPSVEPLQMKYSGEYQYPTVSKDEYYVAIVSGQSPQKEVVESGYTISFGLTDPSTEWADGSVTNHNVQWYITKGDVLPFSPPTALPKEFTGVEQLILSPAQIDQRDGAAFYRLAGFKGINDSEWTTYSETEYPWGIDIPLCTKVGEYRFLYKIDSFNYNSLPPTEITSCIEQGTMQVTCEDILLEYSGQLQKPHIQVSPLGHPNDISDSDFITDEQGNQHLVQSRVKIEISDDHGKTWKQYTIPADKTDYPETTHYLGEISPGEYGLQIRITDTLGDYKTFEDGCLFTIRAGEAKYSGQPLENELVYNGTDQELIFIPNDIQLTGAHFEYQVAEAEYDDNGVLTPTSSWSKQSTTIPQKKNAMLYAVKVWLVAEENYKIYPEDGSAPIDKQEIDILPVTIQKATIKIATLPYVQNELLYYTGSGVSLGLTAGTLDGSFGSSEFRYKVFYYETPTSDPSVFKTNAASGGYYTNSKLNSGYPKPTKVGTYVIQWWVEGDSNHETYYHQPNGIDMTTLTAKIVEKETSLKGINASYTGKEQQIFILPANVYLSLDGETWTNDKTEMYNMTHKTEIGSYTLYWKIKSSGTPQEPVTATISRGTLSVQQFKIIANAQSPRNILFSTTRMAPPTALDISAEQNGGVLAWIEEDVMFVVSSEVGAQIIAPEDCSNLFKDLSVTIAVDLTGLDTSKTTNMSSMFTGFGEQAVSLDVHIIGLLGLDTSNVLDVSHMFEDVGANANTVYIPYLDYIAFGSETATVDYTDWKKNLGKNAVAVETGAPDQGSDTTEEGDTVTLNNDKVVMYAGSLENTTLIAAQWTAYFNETPVAGNQINYLTVTTDYIGDGTYKFIGIVKDIYGNEIELEISSEVHAAKENWEEIESSTYIDENGRLIMTAIGLANKNIVTGVWTVSYKGVLLPSESVEHIHAYCIRIPITEPGDYVFTGTVTDIDGAVRTVTITATVS